MKLERAFTTRESEQASRELIAKYLEGKGYKQRESEPCLVYERGSALSSLFSFSAKHWKATVMVQTTPTADQLTNVVATFDINTTGQMVIKKERDFWEKELDGLIASANGFNADMTPTAKLKEKLRLERRFNEGAKWFFWIAGLSVVNSIILFAGGKWNFLIGLGITQLIDGISIIIAKEVGPNAGMVIRAIALGVNVIIAGIFVLFGILAKRYKWGFIVGMIVYALDGLIFLMVPDFLSIGFHLFVLYGLYGGLKAFGQVKQSDSALAT
jgi:hypothetical protein